MDKKEITIYTIGHSTRSLDEFIQLLKQYNITHLVDIRSIPRSRHNPQFNKEALRDALKQSKIKYTHLEKLGGLRPARADSVNTGWQNKSFRGYADYMATEDFKEGLTALINAAENEQVAIICSEAVPWRCHRSLVGDALLVRGIAVEDIFSLTSAKSHKLTFWAQVNGDVIVYPG